MLKFEPNHLVGQEKLSFKVDIGIASGEIKWVVQGYLNPKNRT